MIFNRYISDEIIFYGKIGGENVNVDDIFRI